MPTDAECLGFGVINGVMPDNPVAPARTTWSTIRRRSGRCRTVGLPTRNGTHRSTPAGQRRPAVAAGDDDVDLWILRASSWHPSTRRRRPTRLLTSPMFCSRIPTGWRQRIPWNGSMESISDPHVTTAQVRPGRRRYDLRHRPLQYDGWSDFPRHFTPHSVTVNAPRRNDLLTRFANGKRRSASTTLDPPRPTSSSSTDRRLTHRPDSPATDSDRV